MCEYRGINLVIGPTGTGKNAIIQKICDQNVIYSKLVIEVDPVWNLPNHFTEGLVRSNDFELPVFITAQTDKIIPLQIRKNARRIFFGNVHAMETYFCREENEKSDIKPNEEDEEKINKIKIGNFSKKKIIFSPPDNRFQFMSL